MGKWAAHFRGLKVLFWTFKIGCMLGIHVAINADRNQSVSHLRMDNMESHGTGWYPAGWAGGQGGVRGEEGRRREGGGKEVGGRGERERRERQV